MLFPLITLKDASSVTNTVFYGEVTNPLLTIPEIFEYRETGHIFIKPLQSAFAICFTYIRIIPCSLIIYNILVNDCHPGYKFVATSLWMLGLFWIWQRMAKILGFAKVIDFFLFLIFEKVKRSWNWGR